MLKNFTIAVFLCIASFVYSQNVGINTTGATPSKNAILDLNTGNAYSTGIIIPHVTLGASLSTFSPPIANAATTQDTGLMVYNMNGAQTPGYYCWSGSAWVSISNVPTTFNPNALVFEGPTANSPLSSSSNMTWNNNHNTLNIGGGAMQSQASMVMNGNLNSYYQCVIHNANNGSTASCDFIAYNDVDSNHYIDLGINSSTYTQAGYTSECAGDAYLYSNASNLVLGAGASSGNDSIKFTVGGLNEVNEAMTICPRGITTQIHFTPDTFVIPVHTGAYSPKYVGEKWIYLHSGDSTECTCISTIAGRKVDSATMGSPIGWTTTITGFSGAPTQTCKYTLRHKTCNIDVNISGTSNATSFTFTLPFIAKNTDYQLFGLYTDNGINNNAGVITYTAGSNVASCSKSNGNFTWTGSGTKAVTGLKISYEVQ